MVYQGSVATVLNCESGTCLSRCEPALLIYVLHPWYTSRMCLLKFCANSIGRSVDIFLPLPGRLVYFSHLCVKLPMVWGLYFITGARINVYVPVRRVRGVPSVIAGCFVTDYQLFKLLSDQQLLCNSYDETG